MEDTRWDVVTAGGQEVIALSVQVHIGGGGGGRVVTAGGQEVIALSVQVHIGGGGGGEGGHCWGSGGYHLVCTGRHW